MADHCAGGVVNGRMSARVLAGLALTAPATFRRRLSIRGKSD